MSKETKLNLQHIKMTKKSQAVEDLLKEVSGKTRQEFFEAQTCPSCLKPVTGFRDKLSLKEYTISGLCQECQDSVFGK